MNTKLQDLFLAEISNSLLFKNRVEFLNINAGKYFDMNINYIYSLNLNLYSEILTLNTLNPFVFKKLKQLKKLFL